MLLNDRTQYEVINAKRTKIKQEWGVEIIKIMLVKLIMSYCVITMSRVSYQNKARKPIRAAIPVHVKNAPIW